jgi:hypothetical protein
MLKMYQCGLGSQLMGYATVTLFSSEDDEFEDNTTFAEWLTEYIKGLAENRLDYLHAVDKSPTDAMFELMNELRSDGYTVIIELALPRIELIDLDCHND